MSGRALFGIVLALVASLIFGIAIGEWYYRLFANAIPEALKAQTNMQGTHIVFVLRGLVVGGLAFVGSLIIVPRRSHGISKQSLRGSRQPDQLLRVQRWLSSPDRRLGGAYRTHQREETPVTGGFDTGFALLNHRGKYNYGRT